MAANGRMLVNSSAGPIPRGSDSRRRTSKRNPIEKPIHPSPSGMKGRRYWSTEPDRMPICSEWAMRPNRTKGKPAATTAVMPSISSSSCTFGWLAR